MELTVAPEVFARFLGMSIVGVVAEGVDNASPRPGVSAAWEAAWVAGADAVRYGNAQSHPLVAPWRAYFRAMGVSPKQFPSSIEALVRRALKGGEPFHINPLVDAYNAISLRHVVPAGGFDLDQVQDRLELRLTRAGDTFLALDAVEPMAVPPGEVAYVTGTTVLTRHFVWRQSIQGLITPSTRRVVLLAEVLAEAGPQTSSLVIEGFTNVLAGEFGVHSVPFAVNDAALTARVGSAPGSGRRM
jgi:DNA/RNA-binding domain of Phe-tRNA-synthetase-like protein